MSATPLDNLAGLRYLLLNEVFTLSHLVIVKLLGIEFASVQIVFIRCLSSAVLLVPLALLMWRGRRITDEDLTLNLMTTRPHHGQE